MGPSFLLQRNEAMSSLCGERCLEMEKQKARPKPGF